MAGAGTDMADRNMPDRSTADRNTAARLTAADVLAGPATAWYQAGASYGPRTLADYELVWPLSGSAVWQATGHRAQRLVPGQVLLVPPGVTDFFRWDPSSPTRHGYVHFRMPTANGNAWPPIRSLSRDDPLDGLLRYLLWLAGLPGPSARERIAGVVELAVDVFTRGPWPIDSAWTPRSSPWEWCFAVEA